MSRNTEASTGGKGASLRSEAVPVRELVDRAKAHV